jgi:hypothetical protein
LDVGVARVPSGAGWATPQPLVIHETDPSRALSPFEWLTVTGAS